ADKDNLANVEAALKATSAELAKARESLTQYQSEEKTLREKLAADDAAVRERMANDDKAVRDKMTADEKALRDRLTAEEKRFKDKVAADEKAHKEKVLADEKAFKEKVAAEDKTFKEKLAAQNEQLKGISKSHVDLTAACRKMEEEYKKLLERQGSITMAIGDLETKKGLLQKDFDGQKAVMMEKFEGEKSQFVKSEQERMEDMRQEMNKRMQKMEQDLLDDMIAKKTAMIKEIYGLIEREVVKVMDAAQWNLISSQVEAHVTEAVNGRVATLSQSTVTSAKPVNLMKKRKMERIRWVSAGLTMGAAIYFGAESIVNVMNQDSTPLRTIAAAEEKKRLDDLEKRKFNPPQTDELKDTYTDAVIYTRDFSKIYLNDDFQNRLFKNTAQYMLKTWRIDEQVTLKALAASKALVQELGDRKTKIHPDFVKDGVDKMHDFEKETLTRLQDILGSE
ncbi:MAG TPA: hypothetical protein VN132_15885, partial [Bdellovibrio sp.]|nr:hypothetical protein [Bdellovibrio sp.]